MLAVASTTRVYLYMQAVDMRVSVHDREVAWRLRGLGLGLLAFEFGGQDAAGTS